MKNVNIDFILKATAGKLKGKKNDIEVQSICLDSRQAKEGALFVPIVGEKVDAHDFIKKVYESGIRVSLSEREDIKVPEDMSIILVENSVKALQDIAKAYRESINIPIVAITGSVGKTTTKEMISLALSAQKKVYKTPANQNSQVGVPKTVLESDLSADVIVIEMGISEFSEMHRISEIVKADVAVVNNIGVAHIQNFGTRESIRDEKLHIIDGMKEGAKLFLNAEDDMLAGAKLSKKMDVEYFAMSDTGLSKNYASHIELVNSCPQFIAHIGGEEVGVELNIQGMHQVLNAVIALTVAKLYGVDLKSASKKLSEFRGFRHRQEIIKYKDITIIDDSYNASPDSMRAALLILKDMKAKRKIAVLADMRELGEDEVNLHRQIAQFIKENASVDLLLTYGELAKNIHDYVREHFSVCEALHFDDKAELDTFLKKTVAAEDVVLFKGSNSMKLFDSVDYITDRK